MADDNAKYLYLIEMHQNEYLRTHIQNGITFIRKLYKLVIKFISIGNLIKLITYLTQLTL